MRGRAGVRAALPVIGFDGRSFALSRICSKANSTQRLQCRPARVLRL
jgi:hypothetical protein